MSSPRPPSVSDDPAAAQSPISQHDDFHGRGQRGEPVPLVDQQALRELAEDFDSPTVAHDFVRDFVQSWEGKFQRLVTSVHQRDQVRAKEAVLSVKVTCLMVGALQLAYLAARTEQLVDSNDMGAAAQSLTSVEACGTETTTELSGTYIR